MQRSYARTMRCLLLILVALTLTQCQMLRKIGARNHKSTPDASDQPTAQAIGKVEMVNPDDRFVLARLTMNLVMAPGTELTLLSENGQISKAKVTPERKGVFITADIVSGDPSKGDIVMTGTVKPDEVTHPPTSAPTAPAGPPSAVNPPTVSISPGNPQVAPPPTNALPDKLAPTESPSDFLRIVPKQ